MGLIGHEIIQSRTWIDPSVEPPKNLNYKLTYPITVFDAVRKDMMDEDSETLTQALDKISQELKNKQNIIPAKPANYLVTYAGIPGEVGSVKMSKEIPWNEEDQSNNRIPTEKAVGDFIRKLGIDPADPDSGVNVRWSDIIGRPNWYDTLGNNEDGFITQKTVTEYINDLTTKIEDTTVTHSNLIDSIKEKINAHTSNMNNPHNITIAQIGAASAEALNEHTTIENPHGITAHTIGLENVDNTSDMNKPISIATQQAIDAINNLINNMTDDVGELNFITDVTYDKPNSTLELLYRDGSTVSLFIPLEKAIIDMGYDSTTKENFFVTNSVIEERIDVCDLFIRYLGSVESKITIKIDGDQQSGDQIIRASINPKSITSGDIADHAIISRHIENQSISASKIKDFSITNAKYANRSITSEKLADNIINTHHIENNSITADKLFRASKDNMILATLKANDNPTWTKITSDMIIADAINTKHILNHSITHDKIAPDSVGTDNITDLSITTEKIVDNAITTDKLLEKSVTSEILAPDLTFEGVTKIRNRPSDDSNNNEIVDTRWVRDFAKNILVVETHNIAKKSITMDKIVSAPIRNRVLAVRKANQDPEWSTINNEMMEDNSIDTANIIDDAVTADKLADNSIQVRHLNKFLINANHVMKSAITSEKIYTSHEANRVLAALSENGHPTYSQVTHEMLAPNSVGANNIMDGEVALSKIESSTIGQQVLTVGLSDTIPTWSKIMTQMINDRAVNGSKLFSSERDNVILAVTRAGQNPTWGKVVGDMIDKSTITNNNIADKTIINQNLADNSVNFNNIMEDAIQSYHIKHGAIKPELIETSPIPGRVIGVSGLPYSTPMWTQVNTSMIEDKAVTRDKIFRSKYPYHVLAATQANVPPEYTMITHQFIVDGTIIPEKLVKDFTLFGTPELTVAPPSDSNDFKLANTKWVRDTFFEMAKYFLNIGGNDCNCDPSSSILSNIILKDESTGINYKMIIEDAVIKIEEIGDLDEGTTEGGDESSSGPTNNEPPIWWPGAFSVDDIPDHAIKGNKLFTHAHGPRVLGITEANGDVEFILIEEDLIVNGAVTTDKIQRSIHLLGSPTIEIRPSPNASDADGNGKTIPDCQWVLDRIIDAFHGSLPDGSGSTAGTLIPHESITGLHIQNRSVTGNELFTSAYNNRLLGVKDANSNPQYLQANNEMIATRAVDGRTLFTSPESNRILAVTDADTDPKWIQVNSDMIEDCAIQNKNIGDRSITENHIDTGAITARTLANEAIVSETQLMENSVSVTKLQDKSVTNTKLNDNAVTNSKIENNTIEGNKLSNDIVLPENASIQSSNNYEERTLRNIVISPNGPRGCRNGDIWFRFS